MNSLFTRNVAVDRYMAEINKHLLLTREQETALAERYRRDGDLQAAHQLVVANLRFVVKICHEYRGYGLTLLDLIQEGNIGLMRAVAKFDPSKGFRLISYAVWWIRAFVQNFILRSWSMVKLGTTQAQRKLFFKLRIARERADRAAGDGAAAGVDLLAKQFGVAESDVATMESRLAARDFSLDTPVQDRAHGTQIDLLRAAEVSQEERVSEAEEHRLMRASVARAMSDLTDRERYIVENRLMAKDEPKTLRAIGLRFQISRERVRQIEGKLMGKIRKALTEEGHAGRRLSA